MIALYILATYLALGVIGLTLTYHNPKSPFYGRLNIETICLGLVTAPGCFLGELWELFIRITGITFPSHDKVIFKRKFK